MGLAEAAVLGYSPDLVRVKAGTPVRLIFHRQDNSGCTERVVFPDFNLGRSLAPFAKTPVEFTPAEPGEYDWACGMNMLHGKVIVEAVGSADQSTEEDSGEFAEAVGAGPTRPVAERSCAHFSSWGASPACPLGWSTSRRRCAATPVSVDLPDVGFAMGSGTDVASPPIAISYPFVGIRPTLPPQPPAVAPPHGAEAVTRGPTAVSEGR